MSILTTGLQVTKRNFAVIAILFFSFFAWYFSFSTYVLQSFAAVPPYSGLTIGALFNITIAVSLVGSSFFINMFSKIRLIYGFVLATSVASLFLAVISVAIVRLIIILALGVLFAIGQLTFFTLFWTLTRSEERGRVAGFAGFFALPLVIIVGLIAQASGSFGSLVLSVVLGFGALSITFLRDENKKALKEAKERKGIHPEKRTILLYLLPWILFSVINQTLARNMASNVPETIPFALLTVFVLQMAASGLGAAVGGMVADFFGRRLAIAFCLTLYGFALILGVSVQNYLVIYFSYAVNGLNWGILWVMYTAVVWGDLADERSVAKRYSLGLSIFYLASGVGMFLAPQLLQIPLLVSALLGCSLIFLSNVPLALAPELLSADFREKIKLKRYVKAVKKIGRKRSQDQG